MKLYMQSSRGYQETEGMDLATVTQLLADLGATGIQSIDEATYLAAVQASQGGY
jgi:hypothetical protein